MKKKKEKKTKECLFVQELLKILRRTSFKWASQMVNKYFFQDTIWCLKLASTYNVGYSKHTFLYIKWSNSTCYNDKVKPICQIWLNSYGNIFLDYWINLLNLLNLLNLQRKGHCLEKNPIYVSAQLVWRWKRCFKWKQFFFFLLKL